MINFKSWKDSGEVKLAPLTGFFGTNSSGKSSLLQMLLLLKQTIGKEEVIFFGDENSLVNLGNFKEVIHGHQSGSQLYLGIRGKPSYPSLDLSKIPFHILDFAFDTVIREEKSTLIIEYLRYISWADGATTLWKNNQLSRDNQHLGTINIQNCYGLPPQPSINFTGPTDILPQFSSVFEELFSHVYYLGPTRVKPQRSYHWEGTHPKEINLWGDKAIDALLSAGVRKLKSSTKEDGVLIEERISEWLQKMELAHSFQLIPTGSLDDKNYEVRIQKSPNSAEVTLADMGHGVADLFPLLVHCYYVPEGSTLILEQPGIHLHPKAQADLADLLIEVITERNLQILIESHSEHLLNRLQRRVAEEKIAADQTALYFCRHIDGASKIDKLDMDEFGNITNWPESFFGDEMGDLFAMTEAQRERQKRETELIEGTTIAPSK
jgi:energy-coupling factor transporter ATP-binding protein EcfA2